MTLPTSIPTLLSTAYLRLTRGRGKASLLFLLLAGCLLSACRTGSAEVVPGDVIADGRVDVTDAVEALKYVAGLTDLGADGRAAADMNADGVIDVNDVALLLRRIVDLEDVVPPVTEIATEGEPGADGSYPAAVTVRVTAHDEDSGVRAITFGAQGARPFSPRTVAGGEASFPLDADGETTVTAYATDNWGNTSPPVSRTVKVTGGKFYPQAWGAKANTTPLVGLYAKAGSATLYAPSGTFAEADKGKAIVVLGAGANGSDLSTSVHSVSDSFRVTLEDAASTTIVDAQGEMGAGGGTDDGPSVKAALDAAEAAGGGIVHFIPGGYRIASGLATPPGARLEFEPGAALVPDVGVTVTVGGALENPPLAQIFGNAVSGPVKAARLGRVTFAPSAQIPEIHPEWWGAQRDAVDFPIGALSVSGTTVTAASPAFKPTDAGRTIAVYGYGAGGGCLHSVITAVGADGMTATLTDAAVPTPSTVLGEIGMPTGGVPANGTTAPLALTAGFPPRGEIQIDSERLYYLKRRLPDDPAAPNTIVVYRGAEDTAPAPHAGRSPVTLLPQSVGYGSLGADDGMAVRAAADALQDKGGGQIVFSPGNYRLFKSWDLNYDAPYPLATDTDVFPSADLFGTGPDNPAGTYLFRNAATFASVDGVSLIGHGATLAIDPTREVGIAGLKDLYGSIFAFASVRNLKIDGFSVTGPIRTVAETGTAADANALVEQRQGRDVGIPFVYLLHGTRDVEMTNNTCQGVAAGLWTFASHGAVDEDRPQSIQIGSLFVHNSLYGVKLNDSGWDTVIDDLKTDTIHRSLIMTGVKRVTANIHTKDNFVQNVLLASYGGASSEDVTVNYVKAASTRSGVNGVDTAIEWVGVHSDPDPRNTGTGTFRNIRLNLDITYAPGVTEKILGPTHGDREMSDYYWSGIHAVQFIKLGNDIGTKVDAGGNGRALENVVISGSIHGAPSSGYTFSGAPGAATLISDELTTVDFYEGWPRSTGVWDEGDTIHGLVFKDFHVDNDQPSRVYGKPIRDSLTLENVTMGGVFRIGDFADLSSNDPNYRLRVTNSTLPNLLQNVGETYGLVSLDLPTSATVRSQMAGLTVTNRGAGGPVTYTLPAARAGLEFTFKRVEAQKIRIEAGGMDMLPGGGVELTEEGVQVTVRCEADGAWKVS